MASKYKSKRVELAGYSFASKLECAVFQLLWQREKAGEISDIRCQVNVYLTDARINYRPDFAFTENGETVYCEAKGVETATWRIKRKLWMVYGPGRLEIYKGHYTRPRLTETIHPRPADKLQGSGPSERKHCPYCQELY